MSFRVDDHDGRKLLTRATRWLGDHTQLPAQLVSKTDFNRGSPAGGRTSSFSVLSLDLLVISFAEVTPLVSPLLTLTTLDVFALISTIGARNDPLLLLLPLNPLILELELVATLFEEIKIGLELCWSRLIPLLWGGTLTLFRLSISTTGTNLGIPTIRSRGGSVWCRSKVRLVVEMKEREREGEKNRLRLSGEGRSCERF